MRWWAWSTPTATAAANPNVNWEEVARRNGATDADVERFRNNVNSVRDDSECHPQSGKPPGYRGKHHAGRLVFVPRHTGFHVPAGALGGYVGAGPTFRLFTMRVDRTAAFDRRDTFVRS